MASLVKAAPSRCGNAATAATMANKQIATFIFAAGKQLTERKEETTKLN
jgi:hypothetical protein